MKKIKQIIIQFTDGSWKGYNKSAFEKVMKIKLDERYGEQTKSMQDL